MATAALDNDLVERVLERLGLRRRPDVSLPALADLYDRWSRRVPFDNIRKLIHVRGNDPRPLPGDSPNEFFEAWLRHGTGGTCWGGNGALCELLIALGYDARRAAATMMVAPDIPPNHGSVVAHLDGRRYVVDASMLFVEPLPLRAGARVAQRAWGVEAFDIDGHFTPVRPLRRDGRSIQRFSRGDARVEPVQFRALAEPRPRRRPHRRGARPSRHRRRERRRRADAVHRRFAQALPDRRSRHQRGNGRAIAGRHPDAAAARLAQRGRGEHLSAVRRR